MGARQRETFLDIVDQCLLRKCPRLEQNAAKLLGEVDGVTTHGQLELS